MLKGTRVEFDEEFGECYECNRKLRWEEIQYREEFDDHMCDECYKDMIKFGYDQPEVEGY